MVEVMTPGSRALLVDVGNSVVKTRGWSRATGLQPAVFWPVDDSLDPHAVLGGEFDGAVMAAVVPAVAARLRDQAARVGLPLHEVRPASAESTVRVRGLYPSMGADRVADIIALAKFSRLPALCVDAGTAVTVDLVAEDGEYVGGLILPGATLMARSLAEGTARLPLVDPGDPELALDPRDDIRHRSRVALGMHRHDRRPPQPAGDARIPVALPRTHRRVFTPNITLLVRDHHVDLDLCFKGLAIVWEAMYAGAHAG